MGSGLSTLVPCFRPAERTNRSNPNQPDRSYPNHQDSNQQLIFTASEPLDETLGHSFCYVRSSARFVSPTPSDRFLSPTHSLRFEDKPRSGHETGFKAISGASVSANAYTPKTVLQLDGIYDDATEDIHTASGSVRNVNGFESTASFSALPLQPVPRGDSASVSGPMERGGFFLSGPIERGALSGPLDSATDGGGGGGGRVPFSAPLGGAYVRKKRKKGVPGFRKAFYRNFSEKKQRPWVVPVLNFVGRKGVSNGGEEEAEAKSESDNVQWALGKAGEDRVHVVVSEEQGWLFVGIYDGFNGPDAPEFLMSNLYRAMHNELKGLFWEVEEDSTEETKQEQEQDQEQQNQPSAGLENAGISVEESRNDQAALESTKHDGEGDSNKGFAKKVTFQSEEMEIRPQRRRLWELLAEDEAEDGLDLSGSDRFAFSVDEAISASNAGSSENRRGLLLSKLKQGFVKSKEGGYGRRLFTWKFRLEEKEKGDTGNRVEERPGKSRRRRKEGPVDHQLVLRAMERALEVTEMAYLDRTDKVLDTYPELALMGSCLLVVLMRDEDVYVMNVGDSRAIVAQREQVADSSSTDSKGQGESGSSVECIVEESSDAGERVNKISNEVLAQEMRLSALQLSTDHSTSIEEEIIRIRTEHPDDSQCIVNDRVKGRLKVTRAFGAGFLKQPKFNDVLLEMFRNEYIGTAPYISCSPSLHHHRLCPRDQFLVLSSDGLYQYLSNQEVVSEVESLMEKFPDGDPAQHLIEVLLFRAATKAGMDFYDLLDIPQGDRRKYHDDVTVMVISLEGRIWKSSGKYF